MFGSHVHVYDMFKAVNFGNSSLKNEF